MTQPAKPPPLGTAQMIFAYSPDARL